MTTTDTMDPFPTAAPRKRRRRAPATGAAADCFTCSNLQAKCDRRRPYCSQCLDNGKECSGYKTALTWGVGVASRGKLRGLSLPIPGNKKTNPTPAQRKRNSIQDNAQPSPNQAVSNPPLDEASSISHHSTPTTASFNFVPVNAAPLSAMPTGPVWQGVPITTQAYSPSYPTSISHNPHPIHVSMPPQYEDIPHPHSATSIGIQSETGYSSPAAYSAVSDEHFNLPIPQQENFFQHKGWRPMNENTHFDDHRPTSWPRNSLSSSIGSSLSSRDFLEPVTRTSSLSYESHKMGFLDDLRHGIKEDPDEDGLVEEIYHGNTMHSFEHDPNSDLSMMLGTFRDNLSNANYSLSQVVPSLGIGYTPRLNYLINYYAEVIAPVIVAFDGPSNPYRTHILPLAMKSETLQHAIAALSASNLRIRKEQNAISIGKTQTLPARRSSIAHSNLTDDKWQEQLVFLQSEDPAREELYHKGVSIQSLNAQLADPTRRKDDSILATLLVLCLFHICDTGVAKFKTQFAGVKKLLALRGNEREGGSKETKWYTRMFTWFDTFTATVNDREGQLSGGYLDMASQSDEEWSMENLAGCDGRLFKIIAKLGRLNVLSQNKPVEEGEKLQVRVPRANPFYANGTFNGHLFDGNGWASLLADEDIFNTHDDSRAQFWREWKDVRQSLEEWSLDMSFYHATCVEICGPNRDDLSNISESFRFSALLYTERLAFPQLPSSHPKIQSFVTQALHYITEVKSDVYLLWPLFITGSECVDEAHRSIVRQRCLDIQKDSGFYNNISCLELLEKIWRDSEPVDPRTEMGNAPKIGGQGFRWRKVMSCERGDGEYIVV